MSKRRLVTVAAAVGVVAVLMISLPMTQVRVEISSIMIFLQKSIVVESDSLRFQSRRSFN